MQMLLFSPLSGVLFLVLLLALPIILDELILPFLPFLRRRANPVHFAFSYFLVGLGMGVFSLNVISSFTFTSDLIRLAYIILVSALFGSLI